MTNKTTSPRIYVASLTDYNNGTLHGAWIDVSGKAPGELLGEIQNMLNASKYPDAEEWAIHDYEGFMGIVLSEGSDMDLIVLLAEAIEEHGEAFAAYYVHYGMDDIEAALEAFQDAYCGEFEHSHGNTPLENYAEQAAEDMGWIKAMEDAGISTSYFDVKQFAHDLNCEGYWEHEGHVFRPV